MTQFGSLIYIAAAGVYIVLRRQSAAHRREIALEYVRLGVPLPPPKPRIEMLEAILTGTMGLIIAGAGGAMITTFLIGGAIVRNVMDPGMWVWLAVMLGGGITLVVLGVRAVIGNMRKTGTRLGSPPGARSPAGQ